MVILEGPQRQGGRTRELVIEEKESAGGDRRWVDIGERLVVVERWLVTFSHPRGNAVARQSQRSGHLKIGSSKGFGVRRSVVDGRAKSMNRSRLWKIVH